MAAAAGRRSSHLPNDGRGLLTCSVHTTKHHDGLGLVVEHGDASPKHHGPESPNDHCSEKSRPAVGCSDESHEKSFADRFQRKPFAATSFYSFKSHMSHEKSFADRIIESMTVADDVGEVRHTFADDPIFKFVVGILVLVNTLQIGIEADYPDMVVTWSVCGQVFTIVFVIEMILKIFALRLSYFCDPWNVLDFSLAIIGVIDTLVMPLLMPETDLRAFTVLRILRLFRLVRILRVFKQLKQLTVILMALFGALKATIWVGVVLTLGLYLGAIFCMQLITFDVETYPAHTEDPSKIDHVGHMLTFNPYLFFGSVSKSMVTLFSIAIMGEWPEVVRPLMIKQPALVIFFAVFALLFAFGVMNVIIGILVDNVLTQSQSSQREEQDAARQQKLDLLQEIQGIFSDIDQNGDGKLGLRELSKAYSDEDSTLHRLLDAIELPQGFAPKEMFCMVNPNCADTVDSEQFVQSFYRLLIGTDFQHMCLMQLGINGLRQALRESQQALSQRIDDIKLELVEHFSCGDTPLVPRNAAGRHSTGSTEMFHTEGRTAVLSCDFIRDLPAQHIRFRKDGMALHVVDAIDGTPIVAGTISAVDRLKSAMAEARLLSSEVIGGSDFDASLDQSQRDVLETLQRWSTASVDAPARAGIKLSHLRQQQPGAPPTAACEQAGACLVGGVVGPPADGASRSCEQRLAFPRETADVRPDDIDRPEL